LPEESTLKKQPSALTVNLACDSASNDFRMADIPILGTGTYAVRAVGTGRYSAWSAWRSADTHPNPWTTRFHVVKVGNGYTKSTAYDDRSRFASPEAALAQAGTHLVQVKNEEVLIFCILDAASDNRGGLTLEITPVP